MNKAIDALVKLGLTEMEARIYAFLLAENPATGYRIASVVGKPVANIYKSITSLEKKGALIIEEDKKRLCRPVPLKEFMSLLERRFTQQKRTAEAELAALQSISEDDRVYQIRSVEEVLERCRFMLKDAEAIAMIDLFPDLLDLVKKDIEACTRRGVKAYIKVYRNVSLASAHLIFDSRGPDVMNDYPGQWLKLATDGREHLLAFMDKKLKSVHQAVWSSSRFLSLLHHYGMVSEMLLDRIGDVLARKGRIEDIFSILADYGVEKKLEIPGYHEFIDRVNKRTHF